MFIQEVELFERIPSHMIDEIAQFASEESYPAGKVLINEGDFAENLYILEDGQVTIVVPGKAGKTFILKETGSVFGWSALVEPMRYSASAKCTSDCRVLKIDGERLLRVLERHPHDGLLVMRRLAGVIGTRLVQSYQSMGDSNA